DAPTRQAARARRGLTARSATRRRAVDGGAMSKQFTEEEVIERIEDMRRRRPRFDDTRITMSHGAGGKASRQLVEGLIVPRLENATLAPLGDAAVVGLDAAAGTAAAVATSDDQPAGAPRLAFTTDAFVVQPLRFPGGS